MRTVSPDIACHSDSYFEFTSECGIFPAKYISILKHNDGMAEHGNESSVILKKQRHIQALSNPINEHTSAYMAKMKF